jgi:hypothetical protein
MLALIKVRKLSFVVDTIMLTNPLDKLLKRLIKETEAILHAEREKPHADQSSDQPSDPPHSLIKQQYNDDLPVYSNEDSGLKQDVKPPKVLNQTNKQKNNTMLYEIDQLKQANHHQKERLKAKDATIKSLKNQINTIQTDGEPTKEMMELYKSLVHSQNNEIKLIKENMKLRLKKKRRSKRKLKKALEKYKAKLE